MRDPHYGPSLPPGVEVSSVKRGKKETYLELSGPDQPDAYGVCDSFPGELALNVPHADDEVDASVNLLTAYTIWHLHEGLEFIVDSDGGRIADPHPPVEDEAWTWLRNEVRGLVFRYRERWPAVDDEEDV